MSTYKLPQELTDVAEKLKATVLPEGAEGLPFGVVFGAFQRDWNQRLDYAKFGFSTATQFFRQLRVYVRIVDAPDAGHRRLVAADTEEIRHLTELIEATRRTPRFLERRAVRRARRQEVREAALRAQEEEELLQVDAEDSGSLVGSHEELGLAPPEAVDHNAVWCRLMAEESFWDPVVHRARVEWRLAGTEASGPFVGSVEELGQALEQPRSPASVRQFIDKMYRRMLAGECFWPLLHHLPSENARQAMFNRIAEEHQDRFLVAVMDRGLEVYPLRR
ncbi:hypothetical protein L596_008260 [Steinernema carpocapsae]|uniref:Uncharacterized protein n=1 Tax=Steinernema carpocapsae TaxID=34508 RepID=A0A4U5PC73_STECR|nr:hypothetical protein L596_008260 [Steinernema carpocapsae]